MTKGIICTRDEKRGKLTVWARVEDERSFCEFMQYIIDSSTRAEDFLLVNPDNGTCYDAYMMATVLYQIRKRSFDERMNNTTTYVL